MFINDVGQSAWEEINDGIAGSNYGWPNDRGHDDEPGVPEPTVRVRSRQHQHDGMRHHGRRVLQSDDATVPGELRRQVLLLRLLRRVDTLVRPRAPERRRASRAASVRLSTCKSARMAASTTCIAASGAVNRIRYTASGAPSITQHPASITVTAGQTGVVHGRRIRRGARSLPVAAQHRKHQRRNSPSTRLPHRHGDNGATFRCVVTNSSGSATSNAATLTVTANAAPTGTITQPVGGHDVRRRRHDQLRGQRLQIRRTGRCRRVRSRGEWTSTTIRTLTRSCPATTGSKPGPSSSRPRGETSANVWYRIYLTVRDGPGLTHTAFRDVIPRTSIITLASVRSGLQLTLDGQPVTSPYRCRESSA